jgi:hypothetical protein
VPISPPPPEPVVVPVGEGEGEGLGEGDGDGLGDGEGLGEGEGDGDGLGEGVGVGVGVKVGVGVGVKVGVGVGVEPCCVLVALGVARLCAVLAKTRGPRPGKASAAQASSQHAPQMSRKTMRELFFDISSPFLRELCHAPGASS